MTPKEAAGRILMVGYEGDPEPVRAALSAGRAGGVILFSRNVESAAQVRELTTSLRHAAPGPITIGIDQEGGRVGRLGNAGIANGPSARQVAATGDPNAAYGWGRDTAARLTDLGLDLDFAPVLDVDSNPANPVIGDRAYGVNPEQVVTYGAHAIRGLEDGGVTACGKHFPGHGDTDLDSHHDLPVVHHDRERLEAIELAPFRALAPSLKAIMTAHVVYPALDPKWPATFSREIVTHLLREEIGFSGIIVSDDLEMGAVAAHHPPEERGILAVAAGVDLLLVCRTQAVWEAVYEGLVTEAERSPEFARRLTGAAERVEATLYRAL